MKKEQAEQGLSFGPYRFDPRKVQLRRGVQEVRLTGKAFAVLRYFVEHPGQLVSKDDLFEAIWPETVVTESTLASCIQELRQALHDDAKKPRYIETVHRRGYRFIAPLSTPPPQVPSAEFRVLSQEERASSQADEADQKSKGENQKLVLSEVEGAKGEGIATEQETGTERENIGQAEGWRLEASGSPRFSPPTRFWSSKIFMLVAIVLLSGTVLTVYYWPRLPLSTQHSVLGTEQTPQALALPDKPAIAVMPFTNMSGDPAQEYFSDGLTDDLITDLSRLSGLLVIARHSVFTYKGKAVKVQDVSKELGVRYVLEGSVRKTDEQVRINA